MSKVDKTLLQGIWEAEGKPMSFERLAWILEQYEAAKHPAETDKELIEGLARVICAADGFDPDADPHGSACCWLDEVHTAKAALSYMQQQVRPLDDDELKQQLLGRAKYLRDRGEIKSPELLERAAAALPPMMKGEVMNDLFTVLNASFEQILGENRGVFTEKQRRDRWASWLRLARNSDSSGKELAKYWSDKTECVDCIHLKGAWCALQGLPCTVNPVLTFRSGLIGMACMGIGREVKP